MIRGWRDRIWRDVKPFRPPVGGRTRSRLRGKAQVRTPPRSGASSQARYQFCAGLRCDIAGRLSKSCHSTAVPGLHRGWLQWRDTPGPVTPSVPSYGLHEYEAPRSVPLGDAPVRSDLLDVTVRFGSSPLQTRAQGASGDGERRKGRHRDPLRTLPVARLRLRAG